MRTDTCRGVYCGIRTAEKSHPGGVRESYRASRIKKTFSGARCAFRIHGVVRAFAAMRIPAIPRRDETARRDERDESSIGHDVLTAAFAPFGFHDAFVFM